jgi:DNA-binding transcriptional LysR family regulator
MLLRNRAEDLVSMADKIEKEFISLDDIAGGDLYFGLAESYQISYLAHEIRLFKQTCPGLRYHITSGDTEQVMEKLDKGLLDFAVLAETPDARKHESLVFPESEEWGIVMPRDDILASKKVIRVDDLIGLPLFCSEQSWEKDIPRWAGARMEQLHLEGSFRLAYNGSIFAKEHLGYLLTFNRLVDTSSGSGLVFRPLSPPLETKLYLVWKKYQTFSPLAERFLARLKAAFSTQ